MSVYTGNTLQNLVPVQLHQTAGPDTSGSNLTQPAFDTVAGRTYFIAIDRGSSTLWQQSFHFSFAPWADNDQFIERRSAFGTSLILSGDNFLATREPDEVGLDGLGGGKSLWWEWTAPDDGVLRLAASSNELTDFPPIVAVYTGDALSSLVFVASSDSLSSLDAATFPEPDREANLKVEVTRGTKYLLAVDTATDGGGFAIRLNFSSLSLVSPVTDATYLAPAAVQLAAALNQTIDGPVPRIDFYAGTNFIGSGIAPAYSFVWTNVPPGQYLVRAVATQEGGRVSESLSRLLAVGISTNDAFASRVILNSTNARLDGNNLGATRERGEPALSGSALGRTLWWQWTAPSNGIVTLAALPRDGFTPALGVFSGLAWTNLSLVADNSYEECAATGSYFPRQICRGRQRPQLVFGVTRDTTYFIALDGYRHNECNGTSHDAAGDFSVALEFQLTSNDDFAQRIPLNGFEVALTNYTFGATWEAGEPEHHTNARARSVWYRWTAPASGRARIGTNAPITSARLTAAELNTSANGVIIIQPDQPQPPCTILSEAPPANSFVPIFAVYTGNTLSNLNAVASGEEVEFETVTGCTYAIAVSGAGEATGVFPMHLTLTRRPANDDFISRRRLVGDGSLITVQGDNSAATREPGEPAHGFDTGQFRSVWWTWTAPASGTTRLRASAPIGYWNGSYYSIYEADLPVRAYLGNDLRSLIPVTRTSSSGEVAFYAVAGSTYQIAVVGTPVPFGERRGSEYMGEFSLSLAGPNAAAAVDVVDSRREPDGSFRLTILGQTGQAFVLQASSDLVNWETLTVETAQGSPVQFIDGGAGNHPHRFYRAAPLDSLAARQPLRIRNYGLAAHATFGLTFQGDPGGGYVLQTSSNLLDWVEAGRGLILGNPVEWSDPDPVTAPTRFYRLLPVP